MSHTADIESEPIGNAVVSVRVRDGGFSAPSEKPLGYLWRYEIDTNADGVIEITAYRFPVIAQVERIDRIRDVSGYIRTVSTRTKHRYAYRLQKNAWEDLQRRMRIKHNKALAVLKIVRAQHYAVEGKGYEQFVHRPEIG